ncbi:uncharacterized protein LOC131207654 [Anopheles bellator]|uniref:uncharacterized protein LOC131207654 n=1 Tax=Anopheles bellator TaxID=139047 RepID=UPI0026483660|nr:uncharacterized protein LOC131207654 [Anopheles bellator]
MNVAASSPSSRKQKRLGPAPIASMEETAAEEKVQHSDAQMDHQNNYQSHRWLNDKPSTDSNRGSPTKSFDCPSALTPATPRIDISRASSHSSHHDSRDSSPENVFDQVGTGTLQDSGVLGFREEDTLDLRNSTEELQFMEPQKGTHEKEKPNTQIIYSSSLSQRYSPIIWKLDDQSTLLTQQHHSQQQQTQQQTQQQLHNRKDSASSEVVAFLSISGRTSRLSSVGSQGSANSKLSATSALSAISRSPSPHKMLLETSFCGAKPLQTFAEGAIVGSSLEASTEKVLEQVILSRKKDPTEAVLAEGVNIHVTTSSFTSTDMRSGLSNCFHQQPAPVGVDRESEETGGKHIRRKSDCGAATAELDMMQQLKVTQTSRSVGNKRHIPPRDLKNSIIGTMPSGTEYIRIKLKPDHCYSDNGIADNERIVEKTKENGGHELSVSHDHTRASERLEPHHNSSTTRSPSPANVSVSRKNSFCSLFKFRDVGPNDKPQNLQQHSQQLSRKKRSSTASNESGMIGGGDMSTNSTPSKQKLVLKMFKSKRDPKSKSPSPMGSTADAIGQSFPGGGSGGDHYATSNMSAERSPGTTGLRYYDAPLDGQSIHIPLHTPPEERSLAGGSFRSTTSGHKTSSHVPVADNHRPVLASATTSQSILKHSKQNTTPKQQRIANMTVTIHDRPKPMPPLKCYRIDNPDGSIIIPLKSPIEEKTADSHQWENVIGELSQRIEMQATDSRDGVAVPTAAGSGSKSNSAPTNHRPASLLYNDAESASHSQKQGSQHTLPAASLPIPPPPPPPPPFSASPSLPSTSCANPVPIVASSTSRKLVMAAETHGTLPQQAAAAAVLMRQRQQQQSFFKLRMGSGSEEQIFSTTLNDYSKELHRNSSNVSQSSSVAALQRSSNENDPEPGVCPPDGIDGDVPSGKPFAGNCSEPPDERAVSVTSSSSPQQVPMTEREKNGVKEPPPEQRQQSQQQHQYVTTSNTEAIVTTSPNGDYAAADATVSRRSSSSPIEYASSEYKNYHYHHQQHHYSQPRSHRQKQRHKHQDSAPTNEDVLIGAVPADVSSESEKDSEIDSVSTTGRHAVRPNMLTIEDHESAGLVFQESFDDELPYIPTTLPEEKPIGIKLMPVKERAQIDLKTYHPLERPRSTTPIHPASLDAYCDRSTIAGLADASAASQALGERGAFGVPGGGAEKLRISLPAKKPGENTGASSGSSAKRILEHRSSLGAITLSTTSVTAAVSAGTARSASAGGAMAKQHRTALMIRCRAPTEDTPSPPPLPPRKATGVTATPPGPKWIDVEALPELRKAPKRITAIPQKPQQQQQQQKQHHDHQSSSSRQPETSLHRQEIDSDGQIYTYVNPEDCQCECHEHERSAAGWQCTLSHRNY